LFCGYLAAARLLFEIKKPAFNAWCRRTIRALVDGLSIGGCFGWNDDFVFARGRADPT